MSNNIARLAYTLNATANFRFKFPEVLSAVLPVEPTLIPEPYEHQNKIKQWLKNDEIDNLILTTCELASSWRRVAWADTDGQARTASGGSRTRF